MEHVDSHHLGNCSYHSEASARGVSLRAKVLARSACHHVFDSTFRIVSGYGPTPDRPDMAGPAKHTSRLAPTRRPRSRRTGPGLRPRVGAGAATGRERAC